MIHSSFGTGQDDRENIRALEMFLDGKISERNLSLMTSNYGGGPSRIHGMMSCVATVGLIKGAREVVENLKRVFLLLLSPLEWISSWVHRKHAEG